MSCEHYSALEKSRKLVIATQFHFLVIFSGLRDIGSANNLRVIDLTLK